MGDHTFKGSLSRIRIKTAATGAADATILFITHRLIQIRDRAEAEHVSASAGPILPSESLIVTLIFPLIVAHES